MTYGQMPPDPDYPVSDADKEHILYSAYRFSNKNRLL